MDAAYLGGRQTLAYFNTGVPVEKKGDNTPVTRADRECEQFIRKTIHQHFPDHTLVGEEYASDEGNPDYKWIIDPIDGTKTFIHGVPLYGVLIGVEVKGAPSVGVIYMPALDEMVSAATGMGCLWNGRYAHVSKQAELAEAVVVSSSITHGYRRSDAFAKLTERTLLQRTWGDCYGYALVATGRADIMIDPGLKLWDCAPMVPILSEAGGRFTTWDGRATIYADDGLATNGVLHEQVLTIVKGL